MFPTVHPRVRVNLIGEHRYIGTLLLKILTINWLVLYLYIHCSCRLQRGEAIKHTLSK